MMKNTLKRVALVAALAALVTPFYARVTHAAPVAQADRAAPPQADRAPAAAPAVGELVRVDPDATTLSIKTAAGAEMKFRYNDQTTVTGSEKTVAGLATMRGSQLTVTFRTEGTANIATMIEVRDK
jgi:uncharacterized protein with beta-barrel porin domain